MTLIRELEKHCGAESAFVGTGPLITKMAGLVTGRTTPEQVVRWVMETELALTCEFEGEVEVEFTGDRYDSWGEWVCPACGHFHRFDVSDDPDRGRDDV